MATFLTSAVISPAALSNRTSVSVISKPCAAEALTSLPSKARPTVCAASSYAPVPSVKVNAPFPAAWVAPSDAVKAPNMPT